LSILHSIVYIPLMTFRIYLNGLYKLTTVFIDNNNEYD